MNDVKYISNLISGEDIYYLKDAEARTNLADKISKEQYAEGVVVDSTRYYTVTGAEKEYWNSKVNPPSYSAPTAKNLTYTGEAQTLLNPGSSTSGSIQYSTDEVNWSTTVPQATNAGTYTVYWRFAGSEVVYVDSTAINVTIAKANPTYTAPTAKTLTYNGRLQDLVNAGTTNVGTFKYGFAPEQYIDPTNGHEYVDLGLPSGTKWATMNVGANAPEAYGNYYMYGKGSSTYNGSDSAYTGGENPLSLSVDTARQVMGGNWHMPTMNQCVELVASTTYEWTTINGVNGAKFTASNGNYIFIPAANYWYPGGGYNPDADGMYGRIWSSEPAGSPAAFYMEISESSSYPSGMTDRTFGHSVRGVTSLLPQGINADTYTIYWKLEGDENYNDVTGTVEVTIAKVTPTVTTAPTANTYLVYNGTAQQLVYRGYTNFGTLQYSLDDETYSTSIPSGTNAGDYTVYYKVVGDSNANDVGAQSVSCSIPKVTPTVTAPTAKTGLVYDGTSQELVNAGSTNWGTLKYSDDGETYSTIIPSATNAGTYILYYKVEGDDNINDVAVQSVSCSIAKADRTVTISDNQTSMTSGQSNTITVTATSNPSSSLVSVTSSNTAVATINGTTVNAVGGGTTTITATVASDTNYNSGSASYTLKVPYPNGVYAAYADGSMRTAANADSNAIGVAVITDNCKFIIDKTNNTTKAWDSKYSTNGVIAGCFATNAENTATTNYTGVSNTNAIAAVASGCEAVKYCRSCSKTIAGKTVYGYLGACGEWQTAYNNKAKVNSIMSTIGGTAISSNSYYWTSTLYLSSSAYAWSLTWGWGFLDSGDKSYASYLVRPLYEIS